MNICFSRWSLPLWLEPSVDASHLAGSLPALYERHGRERAERQDFLLNECNRLRMGDVLRMVGRTTISMKGPALRGRVRSWTA